MTTRRNNKRGREDARSLEEIVEEKRHCAKLHEEMLKGIALAQEQERHRVINTPGYRSDRKMPVKGNAKQKKKALEHNQLMDLAAFDFLRQQAQMVKNFVLGWDNKDCSIVTPAPIHDSDKTVNVELTMYKNKREMEMYDYPCHFSSSIVELMCPTGPDDSRTENQRFFDNSCVGRSRIPRNVRDYKAQHLFDFITERANLPRLTADLVQHVVSFMSRENDRRFTL